MMFSKKKGGTDIYISGLKDRNRALNGDIVAFKLKEKYLWNVLDEFKETVTLIRFAKKMVCFDNIKNIIFINRCLK